MNQATIFKHTVAAMMAAASAAMLWVLTMEPARYQYIFGLMLPFGLALLLVPRPYWLSLLGFTFLGASIILGAWMLVELLRTFWEREQGLDVESVLSVRNVSALVIYLLLSAMCRRRAKVSLFESQQTI